MFDQSVRGSYKEDYFDDKKGGRNNSQARLLLLSSTGISLSSPTKKSSLAEKDNNKLFLGTGCRYQAFKRSKSEHGGR